MPKSTDEIAVFRGQERDELDPKYWFSASTEQAVAIEHFTATDCCLFVLYVQPGVRMLPVYEFERNFSKWENEVIVEGGGYLQFVEQDFTSAMPTYTYRYAMEPFPERTPEPKPQAPPPKTKIEVGVEKDLDQLAAMVDREEIDEELELFELEATKENRTKLIKQYLKPLHKQFDLPFELDEQDYLQIHDLLY